MIWELVGTIVVGIAAGGAVHFLGRLSRGRLPGWTVPAAAGLGMIGFVIYMEYTWAGRIAAQLPPEATVVSRNESTAWFRPWTYIWPFTSRMRVVDARFHRFVPVEDDLVVTNVFLIGRWEPVRPVPVVVNCRQGLRADLRAEVEITEDNEFLNASWLRLAPDDPLLRAVCDAPRG